MRPVPPKIPEKLPDSNEKDKEYQEIFDLFDERPDSSITVNYKNTRSSIRDEIIHIIDRIKFNFQAARDYILKKFFLQSEQRSLIQSIHASPTAASAIPESAEPTIQQHREFLECVKKRNERIASGTSGPDMETATHNAKIYAGFFMRDFEMNGNKLRIDEGTSNALAAAAEILKLKNPAAGIPIYNDLKISSSENSEIDPRMENNDFFNIHEQQQFATPAQLLKHKKDKREAAIKEQVDDLYTVLYGEQVQQESGTLKIEKEIKENIRNFMLWRQNWVHVEIDDLLEEEFRKTKGLNPDFSACDQVVMKYNEIQNSSDTIKKNELYERGLEKYMMAYARFYQRENIGFDLKKLNAPGQISFDKFFENFLSDKENCKRAHIFFGSDAVSGDCIRFAKNLLIAADVSPDKLTAAKSLLQWEQELFNPPLNTLEASASSFEMIEPLSPDALKPDDLVDSFVFVNAEPANPPELAPVVLNSAFRKNLDAERPVVSLAIKVPAFPRLDAVAIVNLQLMLSPPDSKQRINADDFKNILDQSAKYFKAISEGSAPDDASKANAILLAHRWREAKEEKTGPRVQTLIHYAELDELLNLNKINNNFR